MIGEIQRVYRLQGVKINNKHIEIMDLFIAVMCLRALMTIPESPTTKIYHLRFVSSFVFGFALMIEAQKICLAAHTHH